ncbi:MAG: Grx4 family monothiol glutaredoxin [Proteobacteria bacterium]|nr:Grx4 family monothiol glutaredoxin [Pseudomonadota bacterium]
MSLDEATRQEIDALVASHDVMLFMKGSRQAPQCGFSATVVRLLDALIPEYTTLDVLSNPQIREGIKAYSSWPTIPQLYVKGEFVGGCDIVQELFESGELQQTLGVQAGTGEPPKLVVTETAAEALAQAAAQAPELHALHLGIDARYQNSLYLGPVEPGELEIQTGALSIYLDPVSASRADGCVIDAVETPQGPGFQIHNPSAPQVRALPVKDLKAKLDSGEAFELLDVRTPEERAQASIPRAVLLTEDETRRVAGLPKDTVLVFHCHHGGRSQKAAEHFAAQGFVNVFNVVGGIDAWSEQVDPSVPRY